MKQKQKQSKQNFFLFNCSSLKSEWLFERERRDTCVW